MTIEITQDIIDLINKAPYNKTFRKSILKVYAGLIILSTNKKNKKGYFDVPSLYLQEINNRYFKAIDYFEEVGLIEPYRVLREDKDDIFNTRVVETYDKQRGRCKKYRFLKPTTGLTIDIDWVSNKSRKWYDITKSSLEELGYEPKIKRDNFGRRVHHPAIYDYKEKLKGYCLIDAVASQPSLLYLEMKKRNFIDKNYFNIFENSLDFYEELKKQLRLKDRKEAKELFMYWIGGNGYLPEYKIYNLFAVATAFINSHKKTDYKDMISFLQRIESKIWIDDILNNLPVDFALPVHDCLIVKPEDVDIVFDYIKNKYPELKIKKSII